MKKTETREPVTDALAARLRRRMEELAEDGSPLAAELRDAAEAYVRLSERFAKVLAISDKYQELIAAITDGANEAKRNPRRPRDAIAVGTDPLIDSLRTNPDDLVQALIARYEKLNSRINKIVAISDNYQAELRETTARMELMSRTDVLTSLSNRRDMIDRLEVELARATRQQGRFSVIMFDIDDFKQVNDRFGHEAGDAVLVGIAGIFRSLLRRADLACRWGGEEFLVLCPDTDGGSALAVAEKCRAGIEALVVSTRQGTVRTSISGGVGEFASPAEGWEDIVKRADEALYRAKLSGKNRVV
ncbi:MAG: diguanylate cyclase [Spirochaetota bacterium]